MAELSGVNIEKLEGGLGRLATATDDHIAIIATGLPTGAVATAINNTGLGVVITSVYQAEQLGINASFDSNNNITLYDDIVEYFRLAPTATLYLFDKITATELKAFINQNKEIKGYGFHFSAATDPTTVSTTAAAHQVIIDAFAAQNRLIDFVMLAPDKLATYNIDLFALTCPNVSVTVACRNKNGIPSLGAALGMIAVRKVNENMGSVNIINKPLAKRGTADYTLTDTKLSKWPQGFLTNASVISAIDNSVLQGIVAKGYIVAATYEGYGGVFFENSYTCTEQTSDFAFIENNRTWNKAARIVRAALMPEVKGVVKKNPTTGYVASTTHMRWTSLLNKALEQMLIDDEISGFEVYIDPKQVVNNTSPVQVKVTIAADGISHSFLVAVGLTNSI